LFKLEAGLGSLRDRQGTMHAATYSGNITTHAATYSGNITRYALQ
jgi:hypothetical protein